MVPANRPRKYSSLTSRFLESRRSAAGSLQSHECRRLISLIKGIRRKGEETEKKGRKMGQVDQRYRKKAENLLHGELAIALGMSQEEVAEYIRKTVEQAS